VYALSAGEMRNGRCTECGQTRFDEASCRMVGLWCRLEAAYTSSCRRTVLKQDQTVSIPTGETMPSSETMTVVHVAEAGENRGRVVLRLGSGNPSRIAIEAALRVARAYQSELESIFVEDQRLIDLAAHPLVHEVSFCGRERRDLSTVVLLRQFAHAARVAERRIATMARLAEIPYRARTIRDDPVHAVNRACAEAGPWNVVVLADPLRAEDQSAVVSLMTDVAGATGLVVVGRRAVRAHGPIVVVLEDPDRLPPMLRAAERLAQDTGEPILLLPVGRTERASAAMDSLVRLTLADRIDVQVMHVAQGYGHTGALLETLRRTAAGFIVGQPGGTLLPAAATWLDLIQTLECPLFVVR
jgi:hypothetical protein